MILEVVEFHATNPTATLGTVAPTINPGAYSHNYVVRSYDPAKGPAKILMAGRYGATAGAIRLFSPSFHDVTEGLLLYAGTGQSTFLFGPGDGAEQYLAPGDSITIDIAGGAGEVDLGFLLNMYPDPALGTGSFIGPDALKLAVGPHPKSSGFLCTITGTAAGFSGAQPLNATTKVLRSQSRYAILGATADLATIAGVRITGGDTGQYGVFIPVNGAFNHLTANFFPRLSRKMGMDLIPVIQGNNQGATTIDLLAVAAVTPNVTLILAEIPS